MMGGPILEGAFEADVVTGFLAFEILVLENLGEFGLEGGVGVGERGVGVLAHGREKG